MSMMAWRVHEFGPPEAMKFERVPRQTFPLSSLLRASPPSQ
jgi:hypothetical protein